MIGKTLSHYRVVEKLGEGGMGVVWKAVDTELDREVALKVLPEHFADDPERLARFEREAKLLASLNHRNIAAIYGLTQAEGVRFLVMELVEGEDLAVRLARGPLPVDEAVDVGHQLARALDAAHEKGVLHRDLKPANVRLTEDGKVKVLDFGLAKELVKQGDQSKSPTLTSAGTQAGAILGTAAYMSPEQARGKPLDKRSDIWSFGCVLYECLTGRAAYGGETLSDTLASIIKSEPNWGGLPAETPPRVLELLQRCLQKDLKHRLRDIGDARMELERLTGTRASLSDVSGVTVGALPQELRRRTFSAAWLVAALVVGTALGAAVWSALSGPGGGGSASVTRFSISLPKDLNVFGFAASPAGEAVGFVGTPRDPDDPEQAVARGYTRHFGDYEAVSIPGTEEVAASTFSPDGQWLAALTPVAPKSAKLRLSKIPVDGSSPPLALLDWPDGWTAPLLWHPGGDILARSQDPWSVVRIPADGSPPKEPLPIRIEGPEGTFAFSGVQGSVLPDGNHVLGFVTTYDERGYGEHVALLNIDTGEGRILVENGKNAQYASSGQILFTRGESLLAAPFDVDSLALTGAQVAVTDGLRTGEVWNDAWFDITPDGSLLHFPGGLTGGSRQLVFLDGSYKVVGPWSDDLRAFEAALTVSDDGGRIAVTVVNAEGLYDIWVSDMHTPRLSRLVRVRGEDCIPQAWHPDNDRLVYQCGTTEGGSLRIRSSDGSGAAEILLEAEVPVGYEANGFLRDGSQLLVTRQQDNEPSLMLLSLEPAPDGTRTPEMLLEGASNGRISPDGGWLAYSSRASGQWEIYLRSIDARGKIGREIPVTRDACGSQVWIRGPEAAPLELWYSCQRSIYGVTVTAGERVRISKPKPIPVPEDLWARLRGLTFLPDGRMLGIMSGEDEQPPTEINVVLNWLTELEERLDGAR
jgi:hypothetical protein